MWFKRKQTALAQWDLATPVLSLGDRDSLTLANCCEGIAIFGASGAGKTTGSGYALAMSFLSLGMAGLVLTAKAEERLLWQRYAEWAGRSEDLRIISPREMWRFNFLNYEANRPGEGAGLTENIVNLFSEVLELADGSSGGGGREEESYWKRACRQLMRNLVDLLMMAKGQVSIPELYRLVVSLPTSPAELNDPAWQSRSFAFECLREADKRPKSPLEEGDYALVADYCCLEFPGLSERTRSVIVSTFTSLIDVLQRSLLRELFSTGTNLTPEAVQDGAIIVVDLPVKEYGQVGQVAQAIFKYCFMRSIERRMVSPDRRPVFLWADEAQNFTTSYDFQFQATARSSLVSVVYLSQNLSNYYATQGQGEQGKARVDSLMGNLNTKIFHANGDPVTNEWAADLIGKSSRFLVNSSRSYSPDPCLPGLSQLAHSGGLNSGINESIDFEVPPARFSRLRKGGPLRQVDGILFQSGRRFCSTGKPWMPVVFTQRA